MRLIIILVCTLFVGSAVIYAQSSSGSNDADTSSTSFGRASLRYKSDYYYMGRADSSKAPYLIPSIAYYHKSGLHVSSSLSYLTVEGEGRVDLFTLGAGYSYFGKKLATGISVDEYFFNDLSYSVQAEMRTYLSGYVGYDLNLFLIIVDASLGVSKSTDVFLGAEISHTFYLLRNRLTIIPAFYTNLGTQQYYNEYYSKRSMTTGPGSGHGKGKGPGSGSSGSSATITDIYIQESEKFQVLDYETSLQVGYKIRRFRIMCSYEILFPVNPSTVITNNTDTYVEELDTGTYWSVGLRYYIY